MKREDDCCMVKRWTVDGEAGRYLSSVGVGRESESVSASELFEWSRCLHAPLVVHFILRCASSLRC